MLAYSILDRDFKMKKLLVPLVFLCISLTNPFWVYAADTPGPDLSASTPGWLKEARKAVDNKQYDQTVKILQTANANSSADWNNLMGYALRKKNPPDLVQAEQFYQAALKIDPNHRGALEYYGELLLMKNDLPGAEKLLARLDKICTFGCEEYSDLKEAVKKYKEKAGMK